MAGPIAIPQPLGMSQSEVIAVALVGGFIFYLAIQNKLGNYWSLLTGGGAAATAQATAATGQAVGAAAGGGVAAVQSLLGGATTGSSTGTSSSSNPLPGVAGSPSAATLPSTPSAILGIPTVLGGGL